MRLRIKILLFALLTAAAILTLWALPGTRYTLTGHGIETENRYWLWVAGLLFVVLGCIAEYLFGQTLQRVVSLLCRKRKSEDQPESSGRRSDDEPSKASAHRGGSNQRRDEDSVR